MYSLGRDLRYGARLLWNAPAFSLVALITLGLGMGASTAIFSVVDAVLLKPLPFRDPKSLVVVWEKSPAQHKFKLEGAGANFAEWQMQTRTLEGMAAFRDSFLNLTAGPNGRFEPEEVRAERVSASMFPLLGVQAVVGRTFLSEEDLPNGGNYALLSHALWERRFGRDSSVIGKQIQLSGRSCTVVGVLPPGFFIMDP